MAKFLVVLLFLLAAPQVRAQDTLAAIANQNGAPTALSFKELRAVLMGEKQRWDNGTKVVIALIKTNNSLGETICKVVFNMKPDELNKYWLSLVFQGKASAPYFFNSVAELEDFISQNPGAIGITNKAVSSHNVRIITIDRKETI
jgi:hypothetical protein